MRLLTVALLTLMSFLVIFVENDSRSHSVPAIGTDHGVKPSPKLDGDNNIVVSYWEAKKDYFDSETSGHKSASCYAYALREVTIPADMNEDYKLEKGRAYASAGTKIVSYHGTNLLPDGEYALFTEIIVKDDNGEDSVAIGEDSTVNDEAEFQRVVSNQQDGSDIGSQYRVAYGGVQYFSDNVTVTRTLSGNNTIGSIAKSWINNVAATEVNDHIISVNHSAYASASQ